MVRQQHGQPPNGPFQRHEGKSVAPATDAQPLEKGCGTTSLLGRLLSCYCMLQPRRKPLLCWVTQQTSMIFLWLFLSCDCLVVLAYCILADEGDFKPQSYPQSPLESIATVITPGGVCRVMFAGYHTHPLPSLTTVWIHTLAGCCSWTNTGTGAALQPLVEPPLTLRWLPVSALQFI